MCPTATDKGYKASCQLCYSVLFNRGKKVSTSECEQENRKIHKCLDCNMLNYCYARELYFDGEGITGASY